MKKILPHELEEFEKGVTTYEQAVKLHGKPLSYKKGTAKWKNKTMPGTEQHITAKFDADGILQSYSARNVPAPQFGSGFLR